MTSKDLDLINKRVDILFRKQRGDTITAIAEYYNVCRYNIVRHIKRAKLDTRIIEAAVEKQKQIDNTADYAYRTLSTKAYKTLRILNDK